MQKIGKVFSKDEIKLKSSANFHLPFKKSSKTPRPFTIISKWISDELYVLNLKSELYSEV
jgi:hypothetical protein